MTHTHIAQQQEEQRLGDLAGAMSGIAMKKLKDSVKSNPFLGIDYFRYLPSISDPDCIERIILVVGNCQTIGISSLLNYAIPDRFLALPVGVTRNEAGGTERNGTKGLQMSLKALKKYSGRIDLITQPIHSNKFLFGPREILTAVNVSRTTIIPSIYFTCFWPWCFSAKGQLLEFQATVSRNSHVSPDEFIPKLEKLCLNLGLLERMEKNIKEADKRIDLFTENILPFTQVEVIRAHRELAQLGLRRRIMWNYNHPTTATFLHIVNLLLELYKLPTLLDTPSQLRQRPENLLDVLLEGAASRLDQLYASYRIISSHMDTPYLRQELGANYGTITPFWSASYTHYLHGSPKSWYHY